MYRSEIAIDLGAVRRNAGRLLAVLGGAELWAVVKADAYGHGVKEVAGAVLGAGATALCVATIGEGLALRLDQPDARIIVMGPAGISRDIARARDARLELVIGDGEVPDGIPVHLKLDTGMGRWGMESLGELPPLVAGLMTHLATADSDLAYAEWQLERFRQATAPYSFLTRHAANSAAALRIPGSRFNAARCGLALYGLSPFGEDPSVDGLEPALHWTSHLAQVKLIPAGHSAGYGRRFVAAEPTWLGIVPVGYADGFRRNLTGTEVRVAGELRPVVGTVSMDAFAVQLDRELPVGAPVTIVGHGITLESHARVAGTITYELACGVNAGPERARRTVIHS